MASYIPQKKNDANGSIFYVSLVSQADVKLFQANPTLAAGDVKIAIDDGAPANLGTLPAVDADFTDRVKVILSQAETNGDNLTVIFSDAAGAEWCDLCINIQTAAQTLDEMDVNIDDIETDTNEIQGKLPTNKFMGSSDGADDDGTLNTISGYCDKIDDATDGLTAIKAEVEGIGGVAMRGTDNAALATALTTHDGKLDTVDGNVDSILSDTGTDGVVVAGASKTGYALADSTSDAVIADAVWNAATATYGSAGSYGLVVETNVDAPISTVDTVVDGIQTDLSNATDGLGALKALIDAVQTDLDNGTDGLGALKALIDALNDLSAADVNAQVLDVHNTDTLSELAQGAPPATPTLRQAIMLIYMALRNKIDVTASWKEVHNDAGTVIAKKALTDDATTYSEAEMETGP